MCRSSPECRCPSTPSQECCLTLAININQPYECICNPCSNSSQVDTGDVVAGLLKYNSGLTRYLAKYQGAGRSDKEDRDGMDVPEEEIKRDHSKSIIDQYNLKFLNPHDHPLPKPAQPQPEKPQPIDIQTQTSPRNTPEADPKKQPNNPKKGTKPVPGSDEDKIQKHMKDVAASSRYLSNTGFKKYFGRECFENYGRENTTGVADGIVYNNYLKTFNISPHCGTNLPLTEETHRQTLITGDNKNYNPTKIPDTHYGNPVDRAASQGYHKKPLADMPTIIEESEHHKREQERFSKPRCEPNVNIISHCPDLIQQPRGRRKQYVSKGEERLIYYPDVKPKPYHRGASNRKPSPSQSPDKPMADKKQQQNSSNPIQHNRQSRQEDNNRRMDQMSQISPREPPKTMPYTSKQEIPQQRWEDDCNDRHTRKQQLLEQCYRNSQVADRIGHGQKPQCPICRQRRYTKCCCVN